MRISGKYIRLGWVAFFVIAGILLLAAIARRKNSEIKELKVEIKKTGETENMMSELHVEDIIKKAFGSNLVNTQIEDLEISRVELALEQDPAVGDADVYMDAANRLQINITQREPILRIRDNGGSDYYIDPKGKKFPWSKEFTPRVLIATGHIPVYQDDFEKKERSILKDLVNLTRFIRENELWNKMIQQVHVTDKNEFILIPLVGKHKIMFGDADDMDEKFHKLEIFYNQGLTYKGWQEYDVVDIRYKGQVVGRKL
jgi:cell division protein FtsQ